jgi:succinyl-diaminopimelate desuccinylase
LIDKYDLGLIKLNHHEPIYFPVDSPLVETLVGVYRKHTGDMVSQPNVTGGGTYARVAKNLAAFGAEMPGVESIAHQKDENIEINHFINLIRIYADAIIELSSIKV